MKLPRLIVILCAGMLFALGLGLSGMTLPTKVIGFLNLTGAWDPSLAFVMIGAIGVHAMIYQLWLKKRSRPLLQNTFVLPEKTRTDAPLLIGAGLFGIGWGLAGFCPGPALVSVVSLDSSVLIFVLSMLGGMVLFQAYRALGQRRKRQNADGSGVLRQGDQHPLVHRL